MYYRYKVLKACVYRKVGQTPGSFYRPYTTHGTNSFMSHLKDKAMVKDTIGSYSK